MSEKESWGQGGKGRARLHAESEVWGRLGDEGKSKGQTRGRAAATRS